MLWKYITLFILFEILLIVNIYNLQGHRCKNIDFIFFVSYKINNLILIFSNLDKKKSRHSNLGIKLYSEFRLVQILNKINKYYLSWFNPTFI